MFCFFFFLFLCCCFFFFFFNDTATTEIYTLSLHDALPISRLDGVAHSQKAVLSTCRAGAGPFVDVLRNATSLVFDHEQLRVMDALEGVGVGIAGGEAKPASRSEEHTSELQSQSTISYAVFCLKKKKK